MRGGKSLSRHEKQLRVRNHTAERMDILMGEIRALGHIPLQRAESREHREEYNLWNRLRYAKAKKQLCESQLAELAEIARSSVEPVRKRLRVMDD